MRIHIQWCITSLFVASLVSLVAGSALADDVNPNTLLQGKYWFSQHLTCAVAEGFTDPPFQATGSGSTQHIYWTGTTIYDGNGHAKGKGEGIVILPGPYIQGSGTHFTFEQENCTWTYRVHRNGRFDQRGSCSDAGGTYTLTNIKYSGRIGVMGEVLIFAQVEPRVETLMITNGPTLYRICGRHSTAVRVPLEQD